MEKDFAGKRKMESDSDQSSKRAEVMGKFNCLYIHTLESLIQLDLKNSSDFVSFSALKELPPVPTVAVNYDGFSYPFAPGIFQFKSDIYFVGGEYLKRHEKDEYEDEDEDEDGDVNVDEDPPGVYMSHASDKVFKFIPGENRLDELPHMSMCSAKTFPVVEFIEDKFYVLQRGAIYGPRMYWPADHTTFEVLDVSNAALPSWKKLKSPPFYEDVKRSSLGCHFSIRNKFYCLTRFSKLYYFDTSKESWHEEENLSKVCSMSPQMIPHAGRKLSEDVILALKGDCVDHDYSSIGAKLYLIGYLYSKDGCLLAYQIINFSELFPAEIYGTHHFLISMEDGKFCVITDGCNPEYHYFDGVHVVPVNVLAVSIFTVTRLTRADEIQASRSAGPASASAANDNFLSIQVEKRYIFHAVDSYIMQGAFFA